MTETKKQPERTCAVCRRKALKSEFIKIVKTANGIMLDNSYKINGRSVYICKENDCINKAIKTKVVNRAFKKEVPEDIYKELKSLEKPE